MFGNNDQKFFALLVAAGYRFLPVVTRYMKDKVSNNDFMYDAQLDPL